jgi:cysteine desulfurase
VLLAMNVADSLLRSAIRFGVSKFSTVDEIDHSIESISNVYNKLRRGDSVDN